MDATHRIVGAQRRVTVLELLYDVVFVYALSSIATALTRDVTVNSTMRALFLLALIWWLWVSFSWLGSIVRLDTTLLTLAFLAATAATFAVALSMGSWFDGGTVALIGACAYGVVRVVYLVVLIASSRDSETVRAVIPKSVATFAIAVPALIVGALVGGAVQTALLVLAVVVEYASALLGPRGNWPLAMEHFVERYDLVVLIALGEGLVALGVESDKLNTSWDLIFFISIATLNTLLLWSAYFHVVAPLLRESIMKLSGTAQARQARDTYSYLHLLLVVGLALLSATRVVLAADANQSGSFAKPGDISGALDGIDWFLITAALILMRWRSKITIPLRLWFAFVVAVAILALSDRIPLMWSTAGSIIVCVSIAFQTRAEAAYRRAKTAADPSNSEADLEI